jgi:integrase
MKGHVYRRGRTFTYIIDGPSDPLTGKRQQVTKGGWLSEKEAWRECRDAIRRLESGRHVRPSRRTVADFLVSDWLPAMQPVIKATTWANWSVYVTAYVVPTIGKVRLQDLTATRLQAFYGHLLTAGRIKPDPGPAMYAAWSKARQSGKEPTARQVANASGMSIHSARKAMPRFRAGWVPLGRSAGLEPKTVHNIHVMLHKALADAVSWQYVTENVAIAARAPSPGRRKPTVWTPVQLRAFLDFAQEDRFYPLYLLAATTGFRRAELCGLRWSALDLEANTVAVESDTRVVVNGQAQDSDGKTDNAPRLLSLDRATVAALALWRKRQAEERAFFGPDYPPGDRVFTWEDGRPVHPDVLRQRFNRLSQRCGLPHIRLHDIRHSYATAALKAGVNPKIVSQRLGHASVAFTLTVYSHALPGYDREAADTMAALILGEDDQEQDDDVSADEVSGEDDEHGAS